MQTLSSIDLNKASHRELRKIVSHIRAKTGRRIHLNSNKEDLIKYIDDYSATLPLPLLEMIK